MSIIAIRRRQKPIREWEDLGCAVEKMKAAFRAEIERFIEAIERWFRLGRNP